MYVGYKAVINVLILMLWAYRFCRSDCSPPEILGGVTLSCGHDYGEIVTKSEYPKETHEEGNVVTNDCKDRGFVVGNTIRCCFEREREGRSLKYETNRLWDYYYVKIEVSSYRQANWYKHHSYWGTNLVEHISSNITAVFYVCEFKTCYRALSVNDFNEISSYIQSLYPGKLSHICDLDRSIFSGLHGSPERLLHATNEFVLTILSCMLSTFRYKYNTYYLKGKYADNFAEDAWVDSFSICLPNITSLIPAIDLNDDSISVSYQYIYNLTTKFYTTEESIANHERRNTINNSVLDSGDKIRHYKNGNWSGKQPTRNPHQTSSVLTNSTEESKKREAREQENLAVITVLIMVMATTLTFSQ